MALFTQNNTPGHGVLRESVEGEALFFGLNAELSSFTINASIDSATRDAGNVPTTSLRPGLVLGKVAATGQYKHYDATATDGSQVAVGVLVKSLNILDSFGTATDKYTSRVVVGGQIKKESCIGLTPQAEQHLINNGIRFDEAPMPMASRLLAHNGVLYAGDAILSLTAADNGKLVVVTHAAAAFEATLPAIAASEGLEFLFVQTVDQHMEITSAEGENVLATDNATADGVIFSTESQLIGSIALIKCIRTATGVLKWLPINLGNTAMTPVDA